MARRIVEYKTCPPSTYRTDELLLLNEKFAVIEENITSIEFHETIYDNGIIAGENTFTIPLKDYLEEITVDLDNAIDEFYITSSYTKDIPIEVVTKEVAEANDKDLLGSEYYELKKNGGYTVGDDNSYYTQIADTNFYYREL